METQHYSLNDRIVFREIGENVLLVPVGSNVEEVRFIYTLNDSAGFVLKHLRDGLSVAQVTEKLCEEYDVESKELATTWLGEIIAEFKRENIIL